VAPTPRLGNALIAAPGRSGGAPRMLPKSIASIGSSERLVAIVNPPSAAITNLEHAAAFLCVE